MSAFHSLIERLAIGNVYQMPAAVERRSRGKLLPAFLCSNERARHGLDELGHGPALPRPDSRFSLAITDASTFNVVLSGADRP